MRNDDTEGNVKRLLKSLPKVDKVLLHPEIKRLLERFPRWMVVESVREVIAEKRERILKGEADERLLEIERVVAQCIERIEEKSLPSLRKVLNATGVVLHTNLGRAPLSQEAIEHVVSVAKGYSTLEYNLEEGKRGLRYTHVSELLCRLTGAEDAMVVNNNAAAVLLVLNTLAKGREVVISRGELVEIGGSFRIPEVMSWAGAILHEVGTTNRTHLKDYRNAIGPETGLLLKVHPSNYRVMGFVEEVSLKELVGLGRETGIPIYQDLGSGSLVDMRHKGVPYEPTVQESVRAGADLVSFSGDKLLGAGQAGVIVGRRELIEKIRRNPLNRALRIGKLTLAALEATLRLYLEGESVWEKLPALKMISTPVEELMARASQVVEGIRELAKKGFVIGIEKQHSAVGGGALPLVEMPTVSVTLSHESVMASEIEARLRASHPPVISRVQEDKVCLDMRTISEAEIGTLVGSVLRGLHQ